MNLSKRIENIFFENPDTIYSIKDFYGFGKLNKIFKILKELVKSGKILSIINKYFMKREYIEILKEYSLGTSNEELSFKVAEENGWTIVPFEEKSLNMVGLDNQVPYVTYFRSSGPSLTFEKDNYNFKFIHIDPKYISNFPYKISLIIQALFALGEKNITNKHIKELIHFCKYNKIDLKTFKNKFKNLPYWMEECFNKIRKEIENEK